MIEKIKLKSTGVTYDICQMVEVTHAELKKKRDDGELIPGQNYRITDYVATTTDPESRSANHPFDVIVTADDERTLNENARAIAHEGDTYFSKCNLAAWQLKYCLDNDTSRFAWAQAGGEFYVFDTTSSLGIHLGCRLESTNDTTIEGYPYRFITPLQGDELIILSPQEIFSIPTQCYLVGIAPQPLEIIVDSITYTTQEDGKGVIYRMIDENNNDMPYDFKGIQFKRYKITATSGTSTDLVGRWSAKGIEKLTIDEDDFRWCYLFNVMDGDDNKDDSVEFLLLSAPRNCKSGDCGGSLINGVCNHDLGESSCSNWTCGSYCYNWTCGNNCRNWTCGNDCNRWICDYYCDSWTCGNNCYSWTCGNNCRNWICGNDCDDWTCGSGCGDWTCGSSCGGWTCGNTCYGWTCGNDCSSWSCGDHIYKFTIINGTSFSTSTNIPFTSNTLKSQFAGLNSASELKVWTPADLVQ